MTEEIITIIDEYRPRKNIDTERNMQKYKKVIGGKMRGNEEKCMSTKI